MFEKYLDQVLKIFKYVDSVLITDDKGIIKQFFTNRSDINMIKRDEAIGKSILDLYQNLNEGNSTVIEVLKTGKPVINFKQKLLNANGLTINAISSTVPITEEGRIIGTIDVSSYAAEHLTVEEEKLRSGDDLYRLSDIVTIESQMNSLKGKIKKVANTASNVLIYGETGTGKELVAQSLHSESERRHGKFISQNCAAIPSALMESILFGTVKGSFTGAENRPGLFELADGGTLLLDEINSMDPALQSKLLRAVEEKYITRIGADRRIPINVRIVSSTNQSIEEIKKTGNFRKDLLYRLSVVYLEIPPLRERKVDILPLSKYFIRDFNYRMKRNIIDLSDEVYGLFTRYDWPGNVRELRNVIESAFNLSSKRFITREDLPHYLFDKNLNNDEYYDEAYSIGLNKTLEKIERSIIEDALENSHSKAAAAKKLKISKQAFQYKLDKYKIK